MEDEMEDEELEDEVLDDIEEDAAQRLVELAGDPNIPSTSNGQRNGGPSQQQHQGYCQQQMEYGREGGFADHHQPEERDQERRGSNEVFGPQDYQGNRMQYDQHGSQSHQKLKSVRREKQTKCLATQTTVRRFTYWNNGHVARAAATVHEPKRAPITSPKPKRKRDYLAEFLENYQRQLAELRPLESVRGPVHFTIRTSDGKETPFRANSSKLIYLLRVNIQKVLNVRLDDQKLMLHDPNDAEKAHIVSEIEKIRRTFTACEKEEFDHATRHFKYQGHSWANSVSIMAPIRSRQSTGAPDDRGEEQEKRATEEITRSRKWKKMKRSKTEETWIMWEIRWMMRNRNSRIRMKEMGRKMSRKRHISLNSFDMPLHPKNTGIFPMSPFSNQNSFMFPGNFPPFIQAYWQSFINSKRQTDIRNFFSNGGPGKTNENAVYPMFNRQCLPMNPSVQMNGYPCEQPNYGNVQTVIPTAPLAASYGFPANIRIVDNDVQFLGVFKKKDFKEKSVSNRDMDDVGGQMDDQEPKQQNQDGRNRNKDELKKTRFIAPMKLVRETNKGDVKLTSAELNKNYVNNYRQKDKELVHIGTDQRHCDLSLYEKDPQTMNFGMEKNKEFVEKHATKPDGPKTEVYASTLVLDASRDVVGNE
ncbi:hypothetical protein CAEBREN_05367 [Caenorhabditis brenneri]|uniref:Uncharacterized protein n=1 Tax=Caenorhabditis brenneri TaxID=135651 RepID=G0NQV6_CAEBE|nr:hypothetical protein CAEBREN_05367 [Caenorhabditis brenneri]